MGRISSFSGMFSRIGGDDRGGLHLRVRIAGAGQQVLQNGLLLFEHAARS